MHITQIENDKATISLDPDDYIYLARACDAAATHLQGCSPTPDDFAGCGDPGRLSSLYGVLSALFEAAGMAAAQSGDTRMSLSAICARGADWQVTPDDGTRGGEEG